MNAFDEQFPGVPGRGIEPSPDLVEPGQSVPSEPLAAVAQIAAISDPDVRKANIDHLVALLSPSMVRYGDNALHKFRLNPNFHRPDLHSIADEECWKLIKELVENPELLATCRTFYGLLQTRIYKETAKFVERRINPATGMTGLNRRKAHLAKSREVFKHARGRDPEDDELIDFANEQTRAKGTVGRGQLVSRDDLMSYRAVEIDKAESHAAATSTEDIAVLSDYVAAIETTVREAAAISVVHASVAVAYFKPIATRQQPEPASLVEVIERTGLNRPKANAILVEIKDLFKTILVRDHGIDPVA